MIPLYNPKRRPSYNGGVERANGQLAGYQEAQAELRGRPGLPTRADAESALRLANDLARRDGLRGPTAGELWRARAPITAVARAAFLATVEERRAAVRAVELRTGRTVDALPSGGRRPSRDARRARISLSPPRERVGVRGFRRALASSIGQAAIALDDGANGQGAAKSRARDAVITKTG